MKKRIGIFALIALIAITTSCRQYVITLPPRPDQIEVISLMVTETVTVEVNSKAPAEVKATATLDNNRTKDVTATVIGPVDTSQQGTITAYAEYKGVIASFDIYVYDKENVSTSYTNLSETIKNASENDIIIVDGKIDFDASTEALSLKSGMRIIGTEDSKITTSRAGSVFTTTGKDIEISNIDFETNLNEGSDTQFIYYASGSDGLTISDCTFTAAFDVTAPNNFNSRGILVQPGAGKLDIDGCTFKNIRQPAYIEDEVSGTIKNCTIIGTKGWVIGSGSNLEFENNTFTNNAVDIAIIDVNNAGAEAPNNYTDEICVSISQANGNCYVQNQITKINVHGSNIEKY